MLKVFLAEDETLIREGLRDNIPWEQYGYRFVGEAADGEMALPLIRKTKPDVLITEIKMPFMDGLSLSRIVREELPRTKIIIISGYDDFEYAREAISIGVDQYLLKPVTRMNLRKVLQELKEKIEQDAEQEDYQTINIFAGVPEEPVGAGSRAVFAAAGRNPALFSEVSTVSGIPMECKLLWSLNKIRSG